MSIPDFNSYGVLPIGIHEATLDEIEEKLCNIGNITIRKNLFNEFRKYTDEIKKHNVKYNLYVDGSFVTNKNEPGDIDVILAYDFEYYNKEWSDLIEDRTVKIKFNGLQILSAFLDSCTEDETIDFAMGKFHYYGDKPIEKGIIKVII